MITLPKNFLSHAFELRSAPYKTFRGARDNADYNARRFYDELDGEMRPGEASSAAGAPILPLLFGYRTAWGYLSNSRNTANSVFIDFKEEDGTTGVAFAVRAQDIYRNKTEMHKLLSFWGWYSDQGLELEKISLTFPGFEGIQKINLKPEDGEYVAKRAICYGHMCFSEIVEDGDPNFRANKTIAQDMTHAQIDAYMAEISP